MENRGDEVTHKSVLLNEVLNAFGLTAPLKRSVKIIDATLGLAGHTLAMVERGASVLGIDTDPEMLKLAEKKLSIACPIPEGEQSTLQGFWKLRHGNFKDIDKIAHEENFQKVDGVLMDLGISSPQITSRSRGVSFQNDEADLDMRLDQVSQNIKGRDLLNALREDQLFQMFETVMDYKPSSNLAKGIIKERNFKAIQTVGDFKKIIAKVLTNRKKIEIYTLPFLALRIAVNSELDNLSEGLKRSIGLLNAGGKLAVISFHSGEDRIVKNFYNELIKTGDYEISGALIVPTDEEIENNPRARSAKLRILAKK